jgi:hypothetical protein
MSERDDYEDDGPEPFRLSPRGLALLAFWVSFAVAAVFVAALRVWINSPLDKLLSD